MSSGTPALPWKGHLQLLVSHPVFITSGSQDGYCGFSHFSFTSSFQGRMKVGWYVKALFLWSSVIFSWDRDSSNQLSPTSLWREQIHMSTSNPFSQRKMGQYDGLDQTQLFTYAWNTCLLSWDKWISTGWRSVTREDLEWLLVRQPANCLREQAVKWLKGGGRGEIVFRKPQTSPFCKKEGPATPVTTALPEASGITSEMHLILYWDRPGSSLKAFPGTLLQTLFEKFLLMAMRRASWHNF